MSPLSQSLLSFVAKPLFHKTNRGISFIELLVIIAVLGIISSIASPGFSSIIDEYRLKSIAHQIYTKLQFARSEAQRTGKPVNINFKKNDKGWCYGLSTLTDINACDCLKKTMCTIGTKRHIIEYDDSNRVFLAQASFAGPGNTLIFSPQNGMAIGEGSTRNGAIWLRSRQNKLTAVVVSRLGRIRICTEGESACPQAPTLDES